MNFGESRVMSRNAGLSSHASARRFLGWVRMARTIAALVAALLIASCGGGGYGGSHPQAPPPVTPLDFADSGMAVIRARPGAEGVTLLEDRPVSLRETGPQRRITLLDAAGTVRARYSPPQGFFLIDFAQHPSGEITVALASAKTVTLVRLDRAGARS